MALSAAGNFVKECKELVKRVIRFQRNSECKVEGGGGWVGFEGKM